MLWTQDQELELQRLFEEFQSTDGENWMVGKFFVARCPDLLC